MEKKYCKKCKRELPINSKGKYCENCVGERADTAKKVLKGIGIGVGAVASIAITVVTAGKINPKIGPKA